METSFKNELLRRLSAPDLTLLQPHLEGRHLGLTMHLEQASVPIDTSISSRAVSGQWWRSFGLMSRPRLALLALTV